MVSVTIDLGALRSNLEVLRRLAPKSRVMAVIKGNAYGHGLVTVARALKSADALAVARLGEALNLRDAGIKSSVLLLEGVLDHEQLAAAAAADLQIVVHSPEQLELLKGAPAGVRFKIWLKLDSGMNRLGFKSNAFRAAHAALSALPCVQLPCNLCTHLSCADSPELPTTAEQLMVFGMATHSLAGERSLVNSAGLLSFPDSHADWVRPGLALYGISPFKGATGADHGLRPVMTLSSRVIAVKGLAEGEQVGYGGGWTATRATRLAIASVGYGMAIRAAPHPERPYWSMGKERVSPAECPWICWPSMSRIRNARSRLAIRSCFGEMGSPWKTLPCRPRPFLTRWSAASVNESPWPCANRLSLRIV
jgi:alanine racemase